MSPVSPHLSKSENNLVMKQDKKRKSIHGEHLQLHHTKFADTSKSGNSVVIHEESSDSSESTERAIQFEKFKKSILSSLPKEIRSDFKKIGFTKWDRHYHCVLQLGPFDVSPGEVRESWMKMFHERVKSGRPFSRLVYWYGAAMNQAFSLIPANKIIPFEEGIEKGFTEELTRISRKMKNRQKLTENEKLIRRNWKEAKADSLLHPEHRSEWLFDFKEDHEEENDDDSGSHSCEEIDSEESGDHSDDFRMESTSTDNVISKRSHYNLTNSKESKSVSMYENGKTGKLQRSISASDTTTCNDNVTKKRKIEKTQISTSINSSIAKMVKTDSSDDIVDLRILLKPKLGKTIGTNDKSKLYDILVQQNGEIVAVSELRLSDKDKPTTKYLKNQNITLNLSFTI